MDALHTSQIKAGKIKKTAGKNLQFYYDLFFLSANRDFPSSR